MGDLGRALRVAGACVGVAGVGAMATHLGVPGVPWLVNVALLKLLFIGSAGLMTSGAIAGRLAARKEQLQIERN